MNTLENKAKFFAQYWGQKIATRKIGNAWCPLKLNRTVIQSEINKWTLELKPLSSITDEDAIAIQIANPWADYREGMEKEGYINHAKAFFNK